MIDKAINNAANKPDETKLVELQEKIQHLQDANTKLVSDKDEEADRVNTEKNDWILNR